MASRAKGAATLAALMLLAGCDAGAREADRAVEGSSSAAAIRSFAAAMLDQRYTYDEYLERFRSSPRARRLRFQGHLVPAIDVPGLGSCFPRDNRNDFYAEPPHQGREHPVNEFRCIVDHNEVGLSDLMGFGQAYFDTSELNRRLVDVEGLDLPSGSHAELIGFQDVPITGASMQVIVVSDIDIVSAARRAGVYPMLSAAVLDQIGDHIKVRRIRFLRDDSRGNEATISDCPSSGRDSENTVSNSACM